MIELSIAAFERAARYGGPYPSERDELMHLPMTMVRRIPVFDSTRMRDDQIDECAARLKVLAGGDYSARGIEEKVRDFMEAYGALGQRIQDIMDAVSASKPIVLKYLRRLEGAGYVLIKEESTRGAGSRRKRYFWADDTPDYGEVEEVDGLAVRNDRRDTNDGPGVIHHGTACGFLQGCPCGRCTAAYEAGIFGESISSARRAGGSGFAEGVEFSTYRRVAAEREFARAIGLARG